MQGEAHTKHVAKTEQESPPTVPDVKRQEHKNSSAAQPSAKFEPIISADGLQPSIPLVVSAGSVLQDIHQTFLATNTTSQTRSDAIGGIDSAMCQQPKQKTLQHAADQEGTALEQELEVDAIQHAGLVQSASREAKSSDLNPRGAGRSLSCSASAECSSVDSSRFPSPSAEPFGEFNSITALAESVSSLSPVAQSSSPDFSADVSGPPGQLETTGDDPKTGQLQPEPTPDESHAFKAPTFPQTDVERNGVPDTASATTIPAGAASSDPDTAVPSSVVALTSEEAEAIQEADRIAAAQGLSMTHGSREAQSTAIMKLAEEVLGASGSSGDITCLAQLNESLDGYSDAEAAKLFRQLQRLLNSSGNSSWRQTIRTFLLP